jgi:hypothetical protein
VRARVTEALALTFLILAVARGQAQVPPPPQNPPRAAPGPQALPPPAAPGFVSTYEIVRTLRAAGFDPLAPPLREGTVYVARATDYRGILMRVVLDARTGAIRDANRIVPGPGNYAGPYGAASGERGYGPDGPAPYPPGPYASAPDGPDPYDAEDAEPPGPYGPPGVARLPYGLPRDADVPRAAPVAPHPAVGTSVMPLPRPRPSELAARKSSDDAKAPATTAAVTKPSAAVDPKPDPKAAVPTAAPAASSAPAAPTTPPAAPPAKPAKSSSTLTINN